jgi:hypothetical protein
MVEDSKWSSLTLGCDLSVTVPISVLADDPDREVEGFRFVLLLGYTLYEYHTEGSERFLRCLETEQVSGELLIAIDPVAADMFGLVQRRVADELDLSTRRVQLVDIQAVTWADTSLGCPQENQDYSALEIDGYRIVVMAGETGYIFHSDPISIYPCQMEQEVLPEES